MWIAADKVLVTDIEVGKIASTTTRHQNLASRLITAFKHADTFSAQPGLPCGHQASGSATENDGIVVLCQGVRLVECNKSVGAHSEKL